MAELPQSPAHPSYSRLNRLLSSRRPGQALARPVSCRRAGPVRRLHPALHPTCAAPALPVLPTAHAPPPPYRSLLPSAGTSRGHRSRHLPTPMKRPPAFIRRARCRSPLSRRYPRPARRSLSPPPWLFSDQIIEAPPLKQPARRHIASPIPRPLAPLSPPSGPFSPPGENTRAISAPQNSRPRSPPPRACSTKGVVAGPASIRRNGPAELPGWAHRDARKPSIPPATTNAPTAAN